MSARTEAILQGITVIAEGPAWGEPPALYRMAESERVMRLVNLGIEPMVWVSADVQTVLTGLATVIVAGGYKPKPGDPLGRFVGMAFRSEAVWVETDPQTDPLGYHVMSKMAGEHRLHQHPGRAEVRVVVAVDRYGITYYAKHSRGGDTEQLMGLPGREPEMGGATVEALDVMVSALAGVRPPPRPSPYATTTEGAN